MMWISGKQGTFSIKKHLYKKILKSEINMAEFIPGKTKVPYGGVEFLPDDREAIERVLDRNWWAIDTECASFEKELSEVNGSKYAVFANSGTSALHLAFDSLELPKGSKVIVPAVSFPTPVASIILLGLKPVVVDVGARTFVMDLEKVEEIVKRDSNVKAIMPVHAAGNPVDMPRVMEIAKDHDLLVVEDNCDGFGGKIGNKMVGSFGHVSCISTHAAHIVTTGEGGVTFTNDKELHNKLIQLRDWGRCVTTPTRDEKKEFGVPEDFSARYIYPRLGYNLKPLELQAAMGRSQLRRLRSFVERRKNNFDFLRNTLEKYPEYFEIIEPTSGTEPCWFTIPFLVRGFSREQFTHFLDSRNIEWRNILSSNISRQPAYKKMVEVPLPLTNADDVMERGLWLSVNPILTKEMLNYLAVSIDDFAKQIA